MRSVLVLLLACALAGVAAPASAHVEIGFDGDGDWRCYGRENVSVPVPHAGVGPDPHRLSQCYVLA